MIHVLILYDWMLGCDLTAHSDILMYICYKQRLLANQTLF